LALATLKGIDKFFGDRPLLRGVDLIVNEGDRIGLVGPNGAGKSTLLKILAGIEEFDSGERTRRKGLRVGLLEQEPRLDPARSLLQATSGDVPPHKVAKVLALVGLRDPAARCGTLSGGEQRRACLARVLIEEPELVLLDEPTNHLDAFVTAWLEGFLLASKPTLVMVTHDRYFLERIATRIVELDRGALHAYPGPYHRYVQLRAQRLSGERSAERSRRNLLRRETEWLERGPQGRGTKAKARIRRAGALQAGAGEPLPAELALRIPSGPRLGSKVVRLEGVAKRFAERPLFAGLDLHLEAGERVGIVGPNGAGKTTLLRICMGLEAPDSGKVETGATVRFAFVDQARESLDPNRSVLREIAGERVSVEVGGKTLRVEAFLERFLFERKMFATPVGELSGGERNRVLLAKLLLEGGNVLVLDEPTNDLDLMTLRALEEALAAFRGAALVVSHDRWFLDRVATRILFLDGAGGWRLHPGDMSSLLEALAQEPRPATAKKKAVRQKPRSPRRLGYKERRELEALPERITALETELEGIDARLADPATYRRPDAGAVAARRKELAQELAALYDRWEELEALTRGGT